MTIEIRSKEIQMVPIDVPIPYEKNMHIHSDEQIDRLVKLIEYSGFRNPLVLQSGTNRIAAGHGRLMAAKKKGMTHVPVIYQEFESEEQFYAYVVSDNAIGKDSWAKLDLSQINTDIQDLGPFDIDLLGLQDFTVEPLDRLDPQCDEDEVPELKEDPITKRGDVWLLGKHRLMCGDSTMIDDVEKLMNGERADMVFTDPPYNQQESGGRNDSIGKALGKQTDDIRHLIDFDPADFLQVLPTVFSGTLNAYVFTSKDLLPDYLMWAKENKYSFNVLIWKKPNAIPIGGSHRPDIEYLLLFRRSGIFNGGINGVSYSKVIEHGRETGLHPTMKPIGIIENQLKIGSNNDSLVTDFFLGSGSTLIACEKTNRKCYGMELDEHYCDVIINRYMKFTGRDDVILESTGQKYSELKNERR